MLYIQCFCLAFFICLSSAFSTRFIINEEPKKTDEQQNLVDDNLTIEDETIPFKNIFSFIGNQLMNRLKSAPKSGEAHSVLEKLNATIREINKTAQVIRLTAEYINISANYVLSTINQYIGKINDVNELTTNINAINNQILATLINHINSTVNDIETKSQGQVVSGEDLLFSVSYHLVTAFQDMTNMILNITGTLRKNDSVKPENITSTTKVQNKDTESQTSDKLSPNPNFSDTVEVFSPVEIKSLKDQNIPVYYLTTWSDCNSLIRPVCAVDLKIKKYIIFLNDCRRMAHNRMHGTNYSVYGMDVCTGLFLRNPGNEAQVTPAQEISVA